MALTLQPASEDTGDLAVWRAGVGPAVLLIHGVGLRAQAWQAIAAELDDRFELLAIDMPGHGRSPLGGVSDLDGYVDRCVRFLQVLGEPVRVVGHSMGAMIAVELAERLPKQVVAVAALNAIYRRSPEAARAVQARAGALPIDRPADPEATLKRWFGATPQGALREAEDVCRTWLTTVDPVGYKSAYTVFAQHDGPPDDVLARLTCPTLFITGADDPNSTPSMSDRMAALTPLGRSVRVSQAAHMLPMTHPSVVARELAILFSLPEHRKDTPDPGTVT